MTQLTLFKSGHARPAIGSKWFRFDYPHEWEMRASWSNGVVLTALDEQDRYAILSWSDLFRAYEQIVNEETI